MTYADDTGICDAVFEHLYTPNSKYFLKIPIQSNKVLDQIRALDRTLKTTTHKSRELARNLMVGAFS